MLSALLELKPLDSHRFESIVHQQSFRNSLFGGQVLAQGLMAAGQTLAKPRSLHSMHTYFLRPGHIESPVVYDVEVLRDGNSISTREVRAYQDQKLIAQINASFHRPENGFSHELAPPSGRISPSALKAQQARADNAHLARAAEGFAETGPLEFLAYSDHIFDTQATDQTEARFWFRSANPLEAPALNHQCALAFASDIGLLAAALLPHNSSLFGGEVFPASLDHAIWFHRAPDFNQWHQYITDSPWAGHARALCRGAVYDEQDRLVATVVQEGLIRPVPQPVDE